MTKLKQIWKCDVCGNIIEVLHSGADSLVCCNQPMHLLDEQTEDPEKGEKHLPVIDGRVVKIGSVEHPMEEGHYIEWIEGVSADGVICKKFLSPGGKAEVEFGFDVVSARELCNVHGVWEK